MASSSEVGHNKNVANFGSIYQIIQEMGTLYNPSNTDVKLTALLPIKTALGAAITVLNDKKPIYKNAVADRETAIAPLGKKSTSILNYAKSIKISAIDKQNIASQVKKIRGDKKLKKINPETAENDSISTSQMSYDSRIANFVTLISQLASHPEYIPNETELKIATLQAYNLQLTTLSSLVNTAGNQMITARKNRNTLLYYADNNIIEIVKEIKSYVKSLGLPAQPYYKAMVKLKFKDIQKK